MNYSFHPEAEEEFIDSIIYYEACEPALGIEFAREVQNCIQNVLTYPTMWPVYEDDVRRSLVHRFPYAVLYSIELTGIFILAVMHLHRDPDYWRHRAGQRSTPPANKPEP